MSSEPIEDKDNFVGGFVHSLGHSFIQAPIDGVREIVNKMSDKDLVPNIEIVKKPEKAEYGTPKWNGQQLGKTAGLMGMLFIVGRILRPKI